MISTVIIIIFIGLVVITMFDVFGAVLSRKLEFQYVWLSFGSFFLYGLITFYLRVFGNITIAVIGSFLIGAFDGSIGVLIAKKCKANVLKEDLAALKITPKLVLFMGFLAVLIGLLTIFLLKNRL